MGYEGAAGLSGLLQGISSVMEPAIRDQTRLRALQRAQRDADLYKDVRARLDTAGSLPPEELAQYHYSPEQLHQDWTDLTFNHEKFLKDDKRITGLMLLPGSYGEALRRSADKVQMDPGAAVIQGLAGGPAPVQTPLDPSLAQAPYAPGQATPAQPRKTLLQKEQESLPEGATASYSMGRQGQLVLRGAVAKKAGSRGEHFGTIGVAGGQKQTAFLRPTPTGGVDVIPIGEPFAAKGTAPKIGEAQKKEAREIADQLATIDVIRKEIPKQSRLFGASGAGMLYIRAATRGTAGPKLSQAEQEFVTTVERYKNDRIHRISGAATSDQEMVRMRNELPQWWMTPDEFDAAFAATEKSLARAEKIRHDQVDSGGLGPATAAEAPPAAEPAAPTAPTSIKLGDGYTVEITP